MMIKIVRFNIYLAVALCLVLVCGCESAKKKKEKDEKKQVTSLSLHLEVPQDGANDNAPVPIMRASPFYVNVEKSGFVDEGDVERARVVDDVAGFHIELKFKAQGTMVLDGVTTGNRNRRIAIMAQWDKEVRWLAAPLIDQRISDGVIDFTPDCTRAEADRIVRGLNNISAELKKREKL